MDSSGSPVRILVVDDDPAFLDLAGRRLRRSGFEVMSAESWVDASQALLEEPRVVLLDVHLQTLDGDEICRILKRRFPDLRVVLVSAESEDTLRRLAEDSEADGWVSKQQGHDALVAAIQQQLD